VDPELQRVIDENAIRDLVIAFSNAMDARDEAAFRASFADDVDLAIPPLGGDEVPLAGMVSGNDYARGVISLLTGFDATQHVSSNHHVTVDGDEAKLVCYTHATHHLTHEGGHPWLTIGARYDIVARRLSQGWRIVKFRWKEQWADGNAGLWDISTARIRERKG
jgi:ketosteroid isomerase-like protein